jgi:hypothetical protein
MSGISPTEEVFPGAVKHIVAGKVATNAQMTARWPNSRNQLDAETAVTEARSPRVLGLLDVYA